MRLSDALRVHGRLGRILIRMRAASNVLIARFKFDLFRVWVLIKFAHMRIRLVFVLILYCCWVGSCWKFYI